MALVERDFGTRTRVARRHPDETAPHRIGRGHHHHHHQALALRERLPLLPQRRAHAEELSGERARLPAGGAQLLRPVPAGRLTRARPCRHGTSDR